MNKQREIKIFSASIDGITKRINKKLYFADLEIYRAEIRNKYKARKVNLSYLERV